MTDNTFRISAWHSRCSVEKPALNLSSAAHPVGTNEPSTARMSRKGIVLDGSAKTNDSILLPNGFFELVRDPAAPNVFAFLTWHNGASKIVHQIEDHGKLFVPPPEGSYLIGRLTLPSAIQPCGDLTSDLASAISKFVVIREGDILLLEAYILASWFPDRFESVPYLWIVGPLGSAKTTLLKLLNCFCRRALLVGDIHASAIYKLMNLQDPPTLLIDELDLDSSKSNAETLRLLRTGNSRGGPAVRNGQFFPTYGFKAICSRQPPQDPALASRAITISMLPSEHESQSLDQSAIRQLRDEFQPRLLSFRFSMLEAIEDFQRRPWDLPRMTPRMKQIARVLAAPFEGDPERRGLLVTILSERDEANRIERSLEPEWLVAETLFAICHPSPDCLRPWSILVGGIAADVNERLRHQGEEVKLSARKVGSTLTSLGLRTKRLGNSGRGLVFTQAVMHEIHRVVRTLGMDRKYITNQTTLRAGNGGLRCELCEQVGITGGLRFIERDKLQGERIRSRPRTPLFDEAFESKDERARLFENDAITK